MIREVKVRVKLSNANLNILLGITPVIKVILKGVNPILSSPIKGRGIEEIYAIVTFSEPAYSRF